MCGKVMHRLEQSATQSQAPSAIPHTDHVEVDMGCVDLQWSTGCSEGLVSESGHRSQLGPESLAVGRESGWTLSTVGVRHQGHTAQAVPVVDTQEHFVPMDAGRDEEGDERA